MIAVPGTTYWSVAQSAGVSVSAVEAANPWPATGIPVGVNIVVPGGGGGEPVHYSSPSSVSYTPSAPTPEPTHNSVSGGGQFSVPGMPQGLANCIAFRESTDGQLSSNVFGIIPASGYNVAGDSVAQQEQVAGQLYAADGTAPWAPSDGCLYEVC